TDNVNSMASNLTGQVRNIAEVATAVATGDLSRKITVDVKGEILELKNTINTMVDQLNGFAAEVTRVAREVGTEGKLGGQARVPGVAGTWKGLTDNVNSMASNLTGQVRNIAEVATAVATGDLSRKITVDVKGEILQLKETINTMVDQLNAFASEVTRMAREVGTEGRLGGQATVPGVGGTWKDLTDNVNLLAANLTTQVRAIAEVATAVTKGDLTRSIQVDARGEVADLKDYINAMIGNLRATTDRNTEQDWLKTNLAKFSGMMQGQRDLLTLAQTLLSELAPLVNAQQGVLYIIDSVDNELCLRQLAGYADAGRSETPRRYRMGEGLVGQCAMERQRMLLTDIPRDSIQVTSGLLIAHPRNVVVLPVLFEGQIKAVIELASLREFTAPHLAFLEQLTGSIGIVLNTIEATMRTEGLLTQSQQLAAELQAQQKELQQTNEELAQKARLLAAQNAEVERKNREIEQARAALEEKAAELALTSRYKSEFLANMSHELRTPLNSILILGQQLAENADGNLSNKQVEFADTILGAGTDLLNLISDILDLSKIESGTVTVESIDTPVSTLRETIERNFRHVAETRKLAFSVNVDPKLDATVRTDPKRLLQVVTNLLSNAFKFTEQGSVQLDIGLAESGWSQEHPVLNHVPRVMRFAVTDTGIGIPAEKQRIIFEAFQQADAGTARRYGGTGLGLAISRELAHLLGGEIRLRSAPGTGSTFELYLPTAYIGPAYSKFNVQSRSESEARPIAREAPVPVPTAPIATHPTDDREMLQPGDSVLLIVEDDPHYARVLLNAARDHGFKGLVAMRGSEAIALARQFLPTAITLDIFLPDMLGWNVLSQLKQDFSTRHIPVQILTIEEERQHALERGAFAHLSKPLSPKDLDAAFDRIKQLSEPRVRRLLVVEDSPHERMSIDELIAHDDVEITSVGTGGEALELLQENQFDCIVLDLRLPDMTGFELLENLQQQPALRDVPVVVYTGRELTVEEEERLRKLAKSIVLKGVRSPERLLDETALFLHRVVADLPANKLRMLEELHQRPEALAGRKVLVVDDDVRNIFALSSVLERHGMHVVIATTGQEAINVLEQTPDVSLALMDIMMPGMDGYETMRRIREVPRFRRLPIIALTAKAMKGDREKCLEAGASDYVAKPVDTGQLVSLLRTWLHR
ncbi:MAG TPA: response regulator, partial [Steroidobacteraceae bacterium]|nr:response regulator [Steroidobacteraceae bacterium]